MSTRQRAGQRPTMFHGDTRVGPVLAMPRLLAERGVDPQVALREAGLDPRLFDDPENRVPLRALGAFAEQCATRTGCPHFGLLVGQQFRLGSLGILGELARHSGTLRDALRTIALHLELQDRGAIALTFDVGKARAAFGYSLFTGGMPGAAHIIDATLAMEHRLLREFCGPTWKPVLVQFSHSRPAHVAPFRKVFGPQLEFDAPVSAIVFDARWLDHPIAGADPVALRALTEAAESIESREARSMAAQVRRAIHAMTLTGSASSANLGRLFNLHERTLRRRLEEEGVTLRQLVQDVRKELSYHLLRDTDLSVAQVAAILRYSDAAVFSRAFRSWARTSPREWRARQGTAR